VYIYISKLEAQGILSNARVFFPISALEFQKFSSPYDK